MEQYLNFESCHPKTGPWGPELIWHFGQKINYESSVNTTKSLLEILRFFIRF